MRIFLLFLLFVFGCVPENEKVDVTPQSQVQAEETRPTSDGKEVNVLEGTAIAITDGDTFTLKDSSGEEHRIRLGEIDAPEKSQPFGKESTEILRNMIIDKQVTVYWLKKDRFDWKTTDHKTKNGRIIGGVFLEKESVNRKLVEMGAAWHYTAFSKDQTIKVAQDYAKENEFGLWGDKNPTPPWKWRKK